MANVLSERIAGPARPAIVGTAGVGRAPAAFLAGLADGWRAWRRYLELRAMGDAGLARLGLARGDIARHAVLGTAVEPAGVGLSYEAVEHELRTPLTSMRSAAEILLDAPDLGEDDRRRFLRVLVEDSRRLSRTVEHLLGDPGLRRALG